MNEVLAHLVDFEVVMAFYIRQIASQPNGILATWDPEVWAKGLRHRTVDPTAALTAFTAMRHANLGMIGRLSENQYQQKGRYPEEDGTVSKITIENMVVHCAEHDIDHTRQIRTTLKAVASRRRRKA